MTRRILLTLAGDTTSTECGACPHKVVDYCSALAVHLRSLTFAHARHRECIAAEAAAARMVEIAPEDALELCDTMLRHDFDMRLHHPAAQRAGNALYAHADKARGKKEP